MDSLLIQYVLITVSPSFVISSSSYTSYPDPLLPFCLSLEGNRLLRNNNKHNKIKFDKRKQKPSHQNWAKQTEAKEAQEQAEDSDTYSFTYSGVP